MSTIRQNRYLIDCHYIYKHGYIEMYEQVYYRDICVIDLHIFEGENSLFVLRDELLFKKDYDTPGIQ